jgi:hypothetical protein
MDQAASCKEVIANPPSLKGPYSDAPIPHPPRATSQQDEFHSVSLGLFGRPVLGGGFLVGAEAQPNSSGHKAPEPAKPQNPFFESSALSFFYAGNYTAGLPTKVRRSLAVPPRLGPIFWQSSIRSRYRLGFQLMR